MPHAEHFLTRLDRLNTSEVDIALQLYLVGSVSVLITGAFALGAMSLGSSLREIRDAIGGTTDPPLGLLHRLMWEGIVGDSANDTSTPKPRRRSRRKPPA